MRLRRDLPFNMHGDSWLIASSLRVRLNQGRQHVPAGLAELRKGLSREADVEAVE
jgi:hypothetical protein